MKLFGVTWIYGGHDRVVLGSAVPSLFKNFNDAFEYAKSMVDDEGYCQYYIVDDVHNQLYTYGIENDYEDDSYDEAYIMDLDNPEITPGGIDDDELWDLTDGSTDSSTVMMIFETEIN